MLRSNGNVACVKSSTSERLVNLGWEILTEDSPVLPELDVTEKTIEIDGLIVSLQRRWLYQILQLILLLHGFPTSSHICLEI